MRAPRDRGGQADLVGEGHRIADCISLIDAPGHTIGHMAGVLESAGEGAVLCGDAIHHPLEVLYPHRHTVQHDAARNEASVRMLLELCAATDHWLAPQHFMAPHVCKIRKEAGDTGWSGRTIPHRLPAPVATTRAEPKRPG
jgi:glyoxylase-like metal-dependent hydrolase (beta-lactamase superfamily II)